MLMMIDVYKRQMLPSFVIVYSPRSIVIVLPLCIVMLSVTLSRSVTVFPSAWSSAFCSDWYFVPSTSATSVLAANIFDVKANEIIHKTIMPAKILFLTFFILSS